MNFRNKIKAIALVVMMSSATSVLADPIIVLSENKDDYTQTENGYVLNFDIQATAAEIDGIQSNIDAMDGRVTIVTELISEGHYKCTYTVDHQNHPEYVHKMLMVSGFSDIIYQNQNFGLEKVIDVLYSYQD